jgi:hypothetical protein
MTKQQKHNHDPRLCAECAEVEVAGLRSSSINLMHKISEYRERVSRLEFENRVLKQALKLECAEQPKRSPGGCTE